MSNFLTQRGFTSQSLEDKIADRIYDALSGDATVQAVFDGAVRRGHIHISGLAGRPPLCLIVAVVRPEEERRVSKRIKGHVTVGLMLEFEQFATDELAAGEPSAASLESYLRTVVDQRFLHPVTGEERLADGPPAWTVPGAVPNEIRGSLTSFFLAMEVQVPYRTDLDRANVLA